MTTHTLITPVISKHTAKLHERLAEQLARAIVAGEIAPGDPVPSEMELIRSSGVSKTVVRECLQSLGSVGLVRIQHGKRTTAAPQEEWNVLAPVVYEAFRGAGMAASLIRDLFEVRLVIEPTAARWTAERADDEHLHHIREITRGMAASVDMQLATFLEHDLDFHLAIIGAPGSNRVMQAVLHDIHALLASTWDMTSLTTDQMTTAFVQHERIADAVVARDVEGAADAMRAHLEWAETIDVPARRASADPVHDDHA